MAATRVRLFSINECGQLLAAHLENPSGGGGAGRRSGGGRKFQISASSQSARGGVYGKPACPVLGAVEER